MHAREFIHQFVPGEPDGLPFTLLLLHGTGGDERDLLPLGALIAPGAALLSVRGKVLENGLPRFFRRLREGVFDTEDVIHRAHELADFLEQAAVRYRFDPGQVLAAGYSNGANIAAAVLLLRPRTLAGAVLFHPMVPLEPDELPDLARKPVFIAAGKHDPVAQPEEINRLAMLLCRTGAEVTTCWFENGHELAGEEIATARDWLAKLERSRSAGVSEPGA